jgi:hypothetical protein
VISSQLQVEVVGLGRLAQQRPQLGAAQLRILEATLGGLQRLSWPVGPE